MLYHQGRVEVWDGDCRDVLSGFEADAFDACVTDPPYHFASIVKRFANGEPAHTKTAQDIAARRTPIARLARGFMGKKWDGGTIAHEPETWAAVLRVLKPGAHLVCFHAPKNWHRAACAIEDAGFEIRDCLLWLFGSGFPKSHNIQKAIDKVNGVEFEELPASGVGFMGPDGPGGYNVTKHHLKRTGETTAAQWEGWGTALKPAYEPIILARKPFKGSVAENVLAHGTGGINVGACKIETQELAEMSGPRSRNANGGATVFSDETSGLTGEFFYDGTKGRWPANIVHDGSPEVVGAFPETDAGAVSVRDPYGTMGYHGGAKGSPEARGHADAGGSAARFFYTAKADADDRLGSKHPTVKPLDLMQWLVRLVTPPRGHILDPFAGTGTMAEAALREGFRATLIEREPESLADIARRMALAFEGEMGRSVAIAKLKPEGEPLPLFEGLGGEA